MTQIFWNGFDESLLEDGRRLLNAKFTDKETDKVYRWTPKWVNALELIQRAYQVEASNAAGGQYDRILREAKMVAEKAGRRPTFVPEDLGNHFKEVCELMLELGKERFSPDYSLGPTELRIAAEMVFLKHVMASPKDEPPQYCYCPWDCEGWHKIGACCPRCESDPYYRR